MFPSYNSFLPLPIKNSVDSEVEDNYVSSFTESQEVTLLEVKHGKDIKPMLNFPLKNTKKLSDPSPPEFPEEVFTQLINMAKEILLDVSISPKDK